ncbi:urease accessory protein UreF [Gynuella sunshinyii]|uniref:Urease accessory protein UreF n=1 Tax=Gynuella sunshinyii YC6258 TaxID=1445510 RepID=A0A0C5VR02_9GAMM|nr:urease accessory UreF family protein [Gynuella sunshinyii]AJQ96676.1 urease accessory protein UreF [Gynuella sunshinyii YC6258]
MAITLTDTGLLRLLQLNSAGLPVGAFAFSQGLESAVELGWIRNQHDTHEWLSQQLKYALPMLELPVLRQAMEAAQRADLHAWQQAGELLLASRESAELRLMDSATGEALMRLLKQLNIPLPAKNESVTFITLYAWVAVYWQLEWPAAALGMTWSWLENQVIAATKLVPLGQSQAQQLLLQLQPMIAAAVTQAEHISTAETGSSLPALAIASARHEVQYSRLFRS